MQEAIKKLLPLFLLNKIRPLWHGFLAYLAALKYMFPSDKLIVIGVTGTAGKSTTIEILSAILNGAGSKCGYITTVGSFDGKNYTVNTHGMSMPSGIHLNRELSRMLDNGCDYAIIEATSEGLAQNRHYGINFDTAVITNLAPAHIQAHGSFEKYRNAKMKLFAAAAKAKQKLFFGKKLAIINLDDQNWKYFSGYPKMEKHGITLSGQNNAFEARRQGVNVHSGQFKLNGANVNLDWAGGKLRVNLNLYGKFNAYNAFLAISTAEILGIPEGAIIAVVQNFKEIAGRMQEIKNNKGIKIFLDYAPEPLAMLNALETVSAISGRKKIIHLFGSTGGHRDAAKRFEFGEISAKFSDTIIIANDDVYDSDPEAIAKDIYAGIQRSGNKKVKEIITILDRKQAIQKAVAIAEAGDVLLITGKGSEQFLVLPGNKRIEWDEKSIIEEAL